MTTPAGCPLGPSIEDVRVVEIETGTQRVVHFSTPDSWAGTTLLRAAADWMDEHGFDFIWSLTYYNGEPGDTLTVVLEDALDIDAGPAPASAEGERE